MVAKQWGNILAHGQGQDRGILTVELEPDEGTKLTWENKSNGKKLEIPNESIWEVHWRNFHNGCKLSLVLDAGAIALFTGFKAKDKEILAKYFKDHCAGKELLENPINTDGVNCGMIEVKHNELQLCASDGSELLSINLSRVKNCAVPVNNEVEVQCDTDDLRNDEEAVDMIRFFVPPDVDGVANAEELCGDIKAVTDTSQGDVIFEFDSNVGSFMTPRGRYAIEMYADYLRLHGTTYDFAIDYTNIQKIYLLPDPKSISHQFLVMCLKEGLQMGRQVHEYLVLKLKEEVQLVESPLPQAKLDELYGTRYIEEEKRHEPNLLHSNEDVIYKIVAKCFRYVADVKIFKTSDFLSSEGFKAVTCAVGNGDGLMYPLTKGLMYLHKPAMLIPYKSIHEVWLLRLDDKNLLHTFDLEIIWADHRGVKTNTVFKNIAKKESMNLREFLRKKKVTIKQKRGEGPEMVNSAIIDEQLGIDSDDGSSDDEEFTERDANAAEANMSGDDEDDEDDDWAGSGSDDDEEKPRKKKSRSSKKAGGASK